jgi:hypothetical protein
MRWKAPAGLLVVLALVPAGFAEPSDPAPDAAPKPRPSAARLANAAEVRKRLGLSPEYDNVPGIEAVKVAILDYGFDGVGGGRAYLPDNAVVVEHYDPELVRRFHLGDPDYRKAFDPGNRHGRIMAQIVWAVTGFHPNGPKFYLLNASGPTMLRRAIRYAIEQKVDVILFSGSFEGGGNGDGRGPINRAVADALAAGILWVNAAGNYGHCVYNGPVRIDKDGYLRFRDGADGTVLRFRNRVDENTVTVTLTWNDYREQEDAGTDKDLDLYVEDPSGKVIGSSEKTQVSGDRVAGPNESRNPRERVVLTDLPANLDFNYRIRVRARSHNFSWDDRIRVLVTASRDTYVDPATNTPDEGVKFFDATGREELFPPADNPLVLTVGDSSPASAVGPTGDARVKPDVHLEDSRAFFSNGEVSVGSSNAAAYFAGVVAVLKAAEPGLQTRHLLRLARHDTSPVRTTDPRPAGRVPPQVPAGEQLPAPSGEPAQRQLTTRDSRYLQAPVPAPAAPQAVPASPSSPEMLPAPREIGSSSEAPPSYAAPPPRPRAVLVIGPRGRTRILLLPRTYSTGGTGSPFSMLSRANPSVLARSGSALQSALAGRVWQTPSRTRLAEMVRADR